MTGKMSLLESIFLRVFGLKSARSPWVPRLSHAYLSDYHLADLNLPQALRTQIELERDANRRTSLY